MKYTVKFAKNDDKAADLVIKTNDGKRTFDKRIVLDITDAALLNLLYLGFEQNENNLKQRDESAIVKDIGETIEALKGFIGDSTYKDLNNFAKDDSDAIKFTELFEAIGEYMTEIQKVNDKAKK